MDERFHSQKLYQRIVGHIEERIIAGELKDGDRLPTERQLAEQYGVSRTVVREAMKVLARSGLVEARHGSGIFVCHRVNDSLEHSFSLISRLGRINDTFEFREMLEPEVAALAATRATEEDVRALTEAMVAMESATDRDALLRCDLRFHQALAQATQNALVFSLLERINGLWDELRRRLLQFETDDKIEIIRSDHRQILQAVLSRNPAAAREAMQWHFTLPRHQVDDGIRQVSASPDSERRLDQAVEPRSQRL
jgi:GntR family transcriptional repressor for pyruvate dehydrogenase complex